MPKAKAKAYDPAYEGDERLPFIVTIHGIEHDHLLLDPQDQLDWYPDAVPVTDPPVEPPPVEPEPEPEAK